MKSGATGEVARLPGVDDVVVTVMKCEEGSEGIREEGREIR